MQTVQAGYFYKEQLTLTNAPKKSDYFLVEKVLKKKKVRGEQFFYVKFQFYPSKVICIEEAMGYFLPNNFYFISPTHRSYIYVSLTDGVVAFYHNSSLFYLSPIQSVALSMARMNLDNLIRNVDADH